MNPFREMTLPADQQMRRLHFEAQADGRVYYSPYGVQSLLSRTRYVTTDDQVARIIRLHRRLSVVCTLVTVGVLLAATVLFATDPEETIAAFAKVPWLPVPALLLLGMLGVWMPGWITPRLVGPLARGPDRTFMEIARYQESRMGPRWLVWPGAILMLATMLWQAWVSVDIIQKGHTAFGLSMLLTIAVAVPLLFLFPAAMRVRRLRAENERLESVVRERTVQLQELNRTLEARVQQQVRDIERLGQLKHFFSAPVAEMILEGKGFDPAKVHRRELTAVSLDLRGFTAFSETSEPEEVISVLRIYHAELGILVNRCQATLEHFAGDGVMIFFNDPIEVPDHPMRALELAVALRDAMRPHLTEWRSNGFDIGLGIGIATGYATLGAVGYEGRWEYAAIGTVCNLAARLCAEAKDGQVVVSQRFISRLGERARSEALGERPLKGLSRPVAMYNVLGIDEAARATA